MEWVLWMIAVGVLGLAAVAASGRLGELPGTVTDTPRPHVPTGPVTGDDLRALRFAVVPRGYSMDQVDGLLDRLARQLDVAPSATQLSHPGPDGPPAVAAAAEAPVSDAVTPSSVEPAPAPQPDSGPPVSRTPVPPDAERPAFFRPAGEGDPRR